MKILVIEDEEKIANSIKRGLELEKMVVDVAYDGLSGYDLAAGEKYDAIILDLMLPEMDGFTICKKLRADKIQTPILILTAKGELDDKVTGLNIGADDYLVKPFAFSELLARLKAITRRPPSLSNPVITVGDLVLDTVNFTVKRQGKEITLSRKEYSLLDYLMRYPGKILTKDDIISNVWDFDANILPNTVEVYIGYLRKKVDEPFKNSRSLIKTVRGFGYKIEQ